MGKFFALSQNDKIFVHNLYVNMDNTPIEKLLQEYLKQYEACVLRKIAGFIKSKDFNASVTETQLLEQMQDLLQQKSKNPGKKKGQKRTNGYILWLKEIGRPALKGKDMTFGDKAREYARMWKALPEEQQSEWKNKAKNINKAPKADGVKPKGNQQEEQAVERSRQELRRIKDEWNSGQGPNMVLGDAGIAGLVQQALSGELSSSEDEA